MTRREFITLLGGAAAAWPVGAWGQQGERVRRVGVLTGGIDDATERARFDAFIDAMRNLGWLRAKNLQLDIRWGVGNVATIRKKSAAELSASALMLFSSAGLQLYRGCCKLPKPRRLCSPMSPTLWARDT